MALDQSSKRPEDRSDELVHRRRINYDYVHVCFFLTALVAVLAAICIISQYYGNNPDFKGKLSLMATAVSLVLGVVAITYTITEANSQRGAGEGLRHQVDLLHVASRSVHDATVELSNKVASLQSGASRTDQILRDIAELTNKLSDLQNSLAELELWEKAGVIAENAKKVSKGDKETLPTLVHDSISVFPMFRMADDKVDERVISELIESLAAAHSAIEGRPDADSQKSRFRELFAHQRALLRGKHHEIESRLSAAIEETARRTKG
jgi:hypothetical protein